MGTQRRHRRRFKRWLLNTPEEKRAAWMSGENLETIDRFGVTWSQRRLQNHWRQDVLPRTGYHLDFKHLIKTEQRPYTVDFFNASGVAVVLDHLGDEVDQTRDQALTKAGLVVLHFVDAEIRSFLLSVMEAILASIRSRPNFQHANQQPVARSLVSRKANPDVCCSVCKDMFPSVDMYVRHCRLVDGVRYVCNARLVHSSPLLASPRTGSPSTK
jgi:very-short-patch-repair endonuclease